MNLARPKAINPAFARREVGPAAVIMSLMSNLSSHRDRMTHSTGARSKQIRSRFNGARATPATNTAQRRTRPRLGAWADAGPRTKYRSTVTRSDFKRIFRESGSVNVEPDQTSRCEAYYDYQQGDAVMHDGTLHRRNDASLFALSDARSREHENDRSTPSRPPLDAHGRRYAAEATGFRNEATADCPKDPTLHRSRASANLPS
jgi:hypothetical protein